MDGLRPYQWQGVHFLMERCAALLADEMGLGKTVQVAVALDLLLQKPGIDRALVVTPASLRLNWERELAHWAPHLSIRRVLGNAEDRLMYYRLPANVLVASYEQVRADAHLISAQTRFDLIVVDEVQRIKNIDSRTALACRILQRDRSWALSGTPLENVVDELLAVFQFVKPDLLNSAMSRDTLHARMQPHFMRRRKSEVLPELPELIIQDLPLEMEGGQRAAYLELWNERYARLESRTEMHLFALITKLKQLCNYDPDSEESAKLDALRLIVENAAQNGDKIIVFSQYVETLQWLSHRLHDVPHAFYHGGLSETQRDSALTRFSQEAGLRVLLVSLKAGGVGLNLQAASTVVLFDRWWNPAVEEQAIHRAHRFGRTSPLHVFRFLVMDSIEERIAEVIEDKRSLFEAYVEGAESAEVPTLTRRELMRLLDMHDHGTRGRILS